MPFTHMSSRGFAVAVLFILLFWYFAVVALWVCVLNHVLAFGDRHERPFVCLAYLWVRRPGAHS